MATDLAKAGASAGYRCRATPNRTVSQPEPREGRGVQVLRDPVELLFAAAVLASAVLLLYLGHHLTFLFDDWQFLIDRQGWGTHQLLDPHNEHIVLLPVVIYKVLLAIFGMDSAFPFRVVSTTVFLSSALLLFVYLRRRIDPWLALAAAVAILFIGAAYEDLLWSFQLGFFGSMAAGLGMLLALERGDQIGDRLACVLLTASIAFSSLGLSFAAGALVEIALRPDRRRRAYIVAVPGLLFAIWWLGWGHTAETSISWDNFGHMPEYVADALAAGVSSLLGLSTLVPSGLVGSPDIALEPLEWGRPLLVAVVGLTAWRLYKLGRIPPWLWVVAAIGFSFWVLAALNEKPGRTATAPRYQYVSAVFILLIAAELVRGIRIKGAVRVVPIAAAVLIAISGVSLLHEGYNSYRTTSEIERADLGALEIARNEVRPQFALDPSFADAVILVSAGPYFDAADEFGTPAYTPGEIAAAPEEARVAADKVLAAALDLKVRPLRNSAPPLGPPPVLKGPASAEIGREGACIVVRVSQLHAPLLEIPRLGVVLRSEDGGEARVRLRRFAEQTVPVDLGTLSQGATSLLTIPTDSSSVQWKLSLQGSGPVSVCGL